MEAIHFPDESIAEVIAVIEAGLRTAKVSRNTQTQLKRQLAELREYLKDLKSE